MRTNRLVTPFLLTLVGVVLLMGCIYVPASRKFQDNGAPRPESIVGDSSKIVVGRTTVATAFVALGLLLPLHGSQTLSDGVPSDVFIHRTEPRLAFAYRIQTGYIHGLCGTSRQIGYRRLIFTFDPETHVIIASETVAADLTDSTYRDLERNDRSLLFSDAELANLEKLRLFWSDDELAERKRRLERLQNR